MNNPNIEDKINQYSILIERFKKIIKRVEEVKSEMNELAKRPLEELSVEEFGNLEAYNELGSALIDEKRNVWLSVSQYDFSAVTKYLNEEIHFDETVKVEYDKLAQEIAAEKTDDLSGSSITGSDYKKAVNERAEKVFTAFREKYSEKINGYIPHQINYILEDVKATPYSLNEIAAKVLTNIRNGNDITELNIN